MTTITIEIFNYLWFPIPIPFPIPFRLIEVLRIRFRFRPQKNSGSDSVSVFDMENFLLPIPIPFPTISLFRVDHYFSVLHVWDGVVPLDIHDMSQLCYLYPLQLHSVFHVQCISLYRVQQGRQYNRFVNLTLGCQSYSRPVPKLFLELSVGGACALYSAVHFFASSVVSWEGASDVFDAHHYFQG